MALTERHTHHEAEEAPIRLSRVRTVALCLVGALTFFLWLHVLAYGWDVAGCGVFIVLLVPAFWAAVRPCSVARLFGREGH
jgi:hypothetical protein